MSTCAELRNAAVHEMKAVADYVESTPFTPDADKAFNVLVDSTRLLAHAVAAYDEDHSDE